MPLIGALASLPGLCLSAVLCWGAPGEPSGDPAARRSEADTHSPPWNAVAKIQTNIGTKCTGALIAPTVVLTAAHCLYNRRTGALLQPGSVHVLFGFGRGDYAWHGLVKAYVTGAEFAAAGKEGPPEADWARLELAGAPAATAPLPLAAAPPQAGDAVALPGYGQDRNQVLLIDRCKITGVAAGPRGGALVTHDCAAIHGTSGGPLLARSAAGWTVVGVNIGRSRTASIALPAVTPGMQE
ncbi:MAG: trypsin-like serine protease [Alphaproteobacteria bacterium]|nr:trypsin-like serine protease [Alphaproteobacteria bacterium]